MNFWSQQSVEFAEQRNYLDKLYSVYPISPNMRREMSGDLQQRIAACFANRDNEELISTLLETELFPIKDSYVSYLRQDPTAISRNPQTISRIASIIYELGYDNVIERCGEPKETNRQIGPMFKYWVDKQFLGVPVYKNYNDFLLNNNENAVLNMSDKEMSEFAKKYLGYEREKGLDFVARFNSKYIIGEAKFITSFGGHQNAQFFDAVSTLTSSFQSPKLNTEIIPIAIMDGVLYIKGRHKLYRYLEKHDEQIIISSLLLRDFLYSL